MSSVLADTIVFETSASTGRPRRWERSRDQLQAEARVMVARIVSHSVDAVLSFAPATHLYGRVFGTEIPALLDVPTTSISSVLGPLTLPAARRVLIVAVPSSWRLLQSPSLRGAFDQVTVVHGAGVAPIDAGRITEALGRDSRAVEVFGSTESGGIATRRLGCGTDWAVVDDVTLHGAPGVVLPLRVSSPRLAVELGSDSVPLDMTLADRVIRTGVDTFQHLGRTDHVIKVDGRRWDLDDVERRVRAELGIDVACIGVPDALRGSTYDLFVETEATRESTLATLVADRPPRRVHWVHALPRTPRGKVDRAQLRRQATGQPW